MKIELEKVNYIYNKGLANEAQAVKEVSLTIDKPQMIALIGSTGSGKSTLIQMFNGLIQPTGGRILFDGRDFYDGTAAAAQNSSGANGKDQAAKNQKQWLKELRKKVGLVFQYPENQFFDETVVADTSFGPKNQGYSDEEAVACAKAALRLVGVPEELFEKSPFELSGGQMRRAAIAGVLVMDPEVLILDEPTAGLDPQGKMEILDCIRNLQRKKQNLTVLFVSHNMEEVAEYAERVIAMSQGEIVFDGSTKDAFARHTELEKIGLKAPEVTYICEELGIPGVITIEDAVEKISSGLMR